MNNDSLKQQIERATAQKFLDVYNTRNGHKYEIAQVGDAPDVTCVDPQSGSELFIEVTLLEDWEGDIRHQLGRGRRRLSSPETGHQFITFEQDTLMHLYERLEDKLQSKYPPATALLIRQLSPLWSPWEWEGYAFRIRTEVVRGREGHYPAGIWILCSDHSGWPSKDDIFCLTEQSLEDLKTVALPDKTIVRIEAKAAWEGYETPDYLEFAARDDVAPAIRLESEHGCDNVVLVACVKDIDDTNRQDLLARYRQEMNEICLCGAGSRQSSS